MAIAEMQKLNLVGMQTDRNAVLDALERTGAVEIKRHPDAEFTHAFEGDHEALRSRYAAVENALEILTVECANYVKNHKLKSEDGGMFEVSYSEFMSAGQDSRIEETVKTVGELWDKKNALHAQRNRLSRSLKAAEIYRAVPQPFDSYRNTRTTVTKLGTVALNALEGLKQKIAELPLAAIGVLSEDEQTVLFVTYHNACEDIERILSEAGFSPCPYDSSHTGESLIASYIAEGEKIDAERAQNEEDFYALHGELRALKIESDYLLFLLEKAEVSDMTVETDRTFLLEAYVPKNAEEKIRSALAAVTGDLYIGFSDVPADEMPPTLMQNNALVSNFEAVTNMYSVPTAKELDPNSIMSVFYSIFLGFIIADAGYGILMFFLGGWMWWKGRKHPTTVSRLAGVFAIGGIFAVVWGFLFNSFLGFSIPGLPTVMPDAKDARYTFAGVQIPSVLVICMLLGIVHLFTGYLCKAVQCWRRGFVWDGILDGVLWAVFSVGVLLAMLGFVEEFALSVLVPVGGIMAAAMLVIAMLTAGRKEKILGKFTKGFGAAYGIINYLSDVMSYARLYGLMLSGSVIAQLISDYAVTGMDGSVGFLVSGNVGLIILGVVLIFFGHVFNLAISLLGAYIHDARLQYVEFYGRFFEGDGELFKPLGSKRKYIRLNNSDATAVSTQSCVK